MKIPLQISTRKISLSSVAIDIIKQKVNKLESFCDKIIACRIMVETPHRHKHQGTLYNVSIGISIPGAELSVKKEANEDIYVAIRDAFEAARRQIIQYFQKRKSKQPRQPRDSVENTPVEASAAELISSASFLDDYSLNDPTLGKSATSFT